MWLAEYDFGTITVRAIGATEDLARQRLVVATQALALRGVRSLPRDWEEYLADAWCLHFPTETTAYIDDHAVELAQ